MISDVIVILSLSKYLYNIKPSIFFGGFLFEKLCNILYQIQTNHVIECFF